MKEKKLSGQTDVIENLQVNLSRPGQLSTAGMSVSNLLAKSGNEIFSMMHIAAHKLISAQ